MGSATSEGSLDAAYQRRNKVHESIHFLRDDNEYCIVSCPHTNVGHIYYGSSIVRRIFVGAVRLGLFEVSTKIGTLQFFAMIVSKLQRGTSLLSHGALTKDS